MRILGPGGIAAVAAFVGTTAIASAQQPTQQPVAQAVTVVGCLISESDYRKAHDVGRGELGGAGLGDEFVIVNIGPRSAATGASCSEQAGGQAYRVTGKREEELKGLVGRWIEVTGTHEKETYNASSTSKLPPEIEMTAFREAPAVAVAVETPAPSPAPMPNNPPAMDGRGELNAPPTRDELPRTASIEPLYALLGIFCVIAASWLLQGRRREA